MVEGNHCIYCKADDEEYHDKGCPNDDPDDRDEPDEPAFSIVQHSTSNRD